MNYKQILLVLLSISKLALSYGLSSRDERESASLREAEIRAENYKRAKNWLKKIVSDQENFQVEIFEFLKNQNDIKSPLLFAVSKGLLHESQFIISNGIDIYQTEENCLFISKLLNLAKNRLEYLLEKYNFLNADRAYSKIVLDCKSLVEYLNYLFLYNNEITKLLNFPRPLYKLISLYLIDGRERAKVKESKCIIA